MKKKKAQTNKKVINVWQDIDEKNQQEDIILGEGTTNDDENSTPDGTIYGCVKSSDNVYFAKNTITLPYIDGNIEDNANTTYSFIAYNCASYSVDTTNYCTISSIDSTATSIIFYKSFTITPKAIGSSKLTLTFTNSQTKDITINVVKTNTYFTTQPTFYSGYYDPTLSNIILTQPVLNTGYTSNDGYIMFSVKDLATNGSTTSKYGVYDGFNNVIFDAGTYICKYYGLGDNYHNDSPIYSKTFTILPSLIQFVVQPTITSGTPTYNGNSRQLTNTWSLKNSTLSTNNFSITGAQIQYGFGNSASSAPSSWTNAPSNSNIFATNAGTYYLWMKLVLSDSTNYNLISNQSSYLTGKYIGTKTINKANLSFSINCSVSQIYASNTSDNTTNPVFTVSNNPENGNITWKITPTTNLNWQFVSYDTTGKSGIKIIQWSTFYGTQNITVTASIADTTNYKSASASSTYTVISQYVQPTPQPTPTPTPEPTTPEDTSTSTSTSTTTTTTSEPTSTTTNELLFSMVFNKSQSNNEKSIIEEDDNISSLSKVVNQYLTGKLT